MIPDLYTVICYGSLKPNNIKTIKNFSSFISAYHFARDYGNVFDTVDVYYHDERLVRVYHNLYGDILIDKR